MSHVKSVQSVSVPNQQTIKFSITTNESFETYLNKREKPAAAPTITTGQSQLDVQSEHTLDTVTTKESVLLTSQTNPTNVVIEPHSAPSVLPDVARQSITNNAPAESQTQTCAAPSSAQEKESVKPTTKVSTVTSSSAEVEELLYPSTVSSPLTEYDHASNPPLNPVTGHAQLPASLPSSIATPSVVPTQPAQAVPSQHTAATSPTQSFTEPAPRVLSMSPKQQTTLATQPSVRSDGESSSCVPQKQPSSVPQATSMAELSSSVPQATSIAELSTEQRGLGDAHPIVIRSGIFTIGEQKAPDQPGN